MTQIDEPNLDKELDEIIKRDAIALCCNKCDGGGYDYDNTKDCDNCNGTGLTEWQNEYLIKQIKALISDQVAKAVDKTLTDLEDFKQEVLESRGIPNPTYVGKNELQEWIDNRRATLNGVKDKYEQSHTNR